MIKIILGIAAFLVICGILFLIALFALVDKGMNSKYSNDIADKKQE